jgi:radical SAM protein with 4Fe4S-binding SPASM domain
VSAAEFDEVPRLSNPDPFAPARSVRVMLRECAEKAPQNHVRYLWLLVSRHGLAVGDDASRMRPTLDQWLNVLDEAAAIGVGRLVVSAQSELSGHPEVWDICRWAQDTHGMSVGIHIFSCQLSKQDLEEMATLDAGKTVLFVSEGNYECMRYVEERGIKVRVAQRMPEAPAHPCGMPSEMVFVNPRGELYTCGMVEGDQPFRLGTIFEGFLSKISCDPTLPHSVPVSEQKESRGCEGCPPLLARYFYDDQD